MGYNVSYNCQGSANGAAERVARGETDMMIDYPYNQLVNEITPYIYSEEIIDAGPMGYSAQSGFYIPEYTKTYLNALSFGGESARFKQYVLDTFDNWVVFTFPEVVELFAKQNETSIVQGLYQEANFTPPWCNQWNATGHGNNCIDIKSEQVQLDKGVPQQMIMNLKLNMTMSWWGNEGWTNIAQRKVTAGQPFIMKTGYVPSGIFGPSAPKVQRIMFPQYTEECYSNNTASLRGIGSINCDFPVINLRKIATPRIVEPAPNTPMSDWARFFRRLSVSISLLDQLWVSSYTPNYYYSQGVASPNPYSAACDFVRRNSTLWRTWVQNTYTPAERVTWELGTSQTQVMIAFAVIGLVIITGTALLLFLYRDHQVIKGISKVYSLATLVGLAVVVASSLLFTIRNPNSTACSAQLWITPLGLALALGAVAAKTYRIYVIFQGQITTPAMLTDLYLVRIAILPVLVIFITLVVIEAMASPQPEDVVVTTDNKITTYPVCEFNETTYYILVAELTFLVIVITKLAYDARNAPEQFNEAKELGLSMYTFVLAGLVGVPLIAYLRNRNEFDTYYLLIGLFLCLPAVIVTLSLFAVRLNFAVRGFEFEKSRYSANSHVASSHDSKLAGPGSYAASRGSHAVRIASAVAKLPDKVTTVKVEQQGHSRVQSASSSPATHKGALRLGPLKEEPAVV
uniref:G-protein coupled receptors family 3 profile domain-containing protein n=1 Tax=Lotharella globosa TaxID=91324 RepID=A0A6V3J1V6_9EUKA